MITKIKRALISVSDKTDIVELAGFLADNQIEIISSGGTYKKLQENNIQAIEISDLTKMPEMMGGRVKTLHPKIHGGILARRGIDDEVAQENQINYIDLVVVNLYPFAEVTAKKDCNIETAIENIDIGGPAMIRSAAKNNKFTAVVVDVKDYKNIIKSIKDNKGIDDDLRYQLAVKAFRHTAIYDSIIFSYLNKQKPVIDTLKEDDFLLYGKKTHQLRYGENPQQQANAYNFGNDNEPAITNSQQIHGIELSYNNWSDASTAFECASKISPPACVIVKHANPCGAAFDDDILTAYDKAFSADPTSAFGGIIAINRNLTVELIELILSKQFVEVIIAPACDCIEAIKKAVEHKPKLRILITGHKKLNTNQLLVQDINGGFLLQEPLNLTPIMTDIKSASNHKFTGNEQDCELAWQMVACVKSNAIVLVKNGVTIGIGCGQTNRVSSVEIALNNAKKLGFELEGAIVASDAFFPFRDSVDMLAGHKISAIIQPGGSMRDNEVIEAANEHKIAMLLTNNRVFRH